jgi:hypothetical protein
VKAAETPNPCETTAKRVATTGENFSNATIELVADPLDNYRLNLLLWDGSRATIAPSIKYGRYVYKPIALEPTFLNTVHWPKSSVRYGSTRSLFEKVLSVITQHVEIPDPSARLLTHFVLSTWFPDRLSLCPGLAILGPTDSDGIQVLRLLRCLCRRAMLLAEVSHTGLLSLPLQLSPTLLMNRPVLTRSLRNFLSTSNRRGLATVTRGKVLEVCCPKAIFLGMDAIPQEIASVMIQISLSEASTKMSALGTGAANDVAADLQGELLAYRLANCSKVHVSYLHGTSFTHQTREIAMNLSACIVDDKELAGEVIPLLHEQDDHFRGQRDQKLDAAILCAVLTCLHEKKSDRVQVKEIASLANSLLRTQGEITEYSPEEVGHRLDGFSLVRTRQNEGMFLFLRSDTSRLVHRLALRYGTWEVNSVVGCRDCELLRDPAAIV